MMTDEESVPVVVFSEMVNSGETIDFTLEGAATGVTASGPSLIFQPGSYDVKIHLPNNFSGEGQIAWLHPSGLVRSTPPLAVTSLDPGQTWVEFGLLNELSSGSETFTFRLSTPDPEPGIVTVVPTVVSDPPPTIELRSS
jgi:hypothetical protein